MNDEYKSFAVIDSYAEDEWLILISEDGVNINSVKDEKGRIIYFNSQRSAKIQASKRNLIVVKFDEFLENLDTKEKEEKDLTYMEVYKAVFPSMFVKYSILEMWDGCYCLAKTENMCGGYYNNRDNSLKYLTKNRALVPFLQGNHFNLSQTDFTKLTSYTEDDLAEWSKLQETELAGLEKLYEPLFLGQVFINYNALHNLSKMSISASSYAKLLDFKTKDYSYISLSELAAERGLWNFASTEINRIMNSKIPAIKVLFDSGEYLFMVPPESINLFLPNKKLTKLEEYKAREDETLSEARETATESLLDSEPPAAELGEKNAEKVTVKNKQAMAFLNRLITDAEDLLAFGNVHEEECVGKYEAYLRKLKTYRNECEEAGKVNLKDMPKIEDFLPNLKLNWREEKHSKLSNEIERLMAKNTGVNL